MQAFDSSRSGFPRTSFCSRSFVCPVVCPFVSRNLDVSTLKELAKRWKPEILAGFKKAQAHTALADVHESIDELAYYREHLLVK